MCFGLKIDSDICLPDIGADTVEGNEDDLVEFDTPASDFPFWVGC